MRFLLLLLLAPLLAGADTPANRLDVDIERLRNARGAIHACLTGNSRFFPDCRKDPAALKQTIPATARQLSFTGFAPGTYALTVVHDENLNHKLDTTLGIPREGFGFSRNPVVRFGAPKFRQVDIKLGSGFTRASVRMQYLL